LLHERLMPSASRGWSGSVFTTEKWRRNSLDRRAGSSDRRVSGYV
jgi:hypothetical protein